MRLMNNITDSVSIYESHYYILNFLEEICFSFCGKTNEDAFDNNVTVYYKIGYHIKASALLIIVLLCSLFVNF
jgi:hypothetical protein